MKFSGKVLTFAIVLIIGVSSLNLRAEENDGIPMMRKLGRGITNLGLGALEIPVKIYDVNEEEGGFAAVTYGVLKGVCYFIAREVIGLVDILTFPIPLPGATVDTHEEGWGYGPLMRPEFVLDKRHDFYNVVYQDLPAE
ncbi:MAG: exosortase system-associated protein, TIGR04073 family [Kiritimatiellaeota bacterium]|nr:exosortase system-associated protein, TIGR04073 family [Kiritimatiellota bacterium]